MQRSLTASGKLALVLPVQSTSNKDDIVFRQFAIIQHGSSFSAQHVYHSTKHAHHHPDQQTRLYLIILLVSTITVPFNQSTDILLTSSFYSSHGNNVTSRLDTFLKNLLSGFIRWDAVYFVSIAADGYRFEQQYAFFPLAAIGNEIWIETVVLPAQCFRDHQDDPCGSCLYQCLPRLVLHFVIQPDETFVQQ